MNAENFKFENNELMTYNELIEYFGAEHPIKKAELIAKKLKKYVFIKNKIIYKLQKNLTYLSDSCIDDVLYVTISLLIYESMQNLKDNEIKSFNDRYDDKQIRKSLFTNLYISKYLIQLQEALKKNNIVLDSYKYQIHFNNGNIDIADKNKFKQRKIGINYITKYIKRDYKKSTKEERSKVNIKVKQVYPNKEDRETILEIIASGLSGDSMKDQKNAISIRFRFYW